MTSYRKSLAQNPNICSASRNLRSTFHQRSRKEKASFVPLKSGILSVSKCCEIQRKKSRPATQTKPLSKLQSTWACTIKINQQYVHVQMCTCVQCTCLCVCALRHLKMKLIGKPVRKQLHGFSPPMNKSDSLVPRHPPQPKTSQEVQQLIGSNENHHQSPSQLAIACGLHGKNKSSKCTYAPYGIKDHEGRTSL